MSLEAHKGAAPRQLRFAVITISDTRDASTDRGGPFLVESVTGAGHAVTLREIVKDESAEIEAAVRRAVAHAEVDLVLTTGGTGIAPRDVTFETLRRVLDSEIPGFGELFRWLSFREIGAATILSRAIGGVLARKVVLEVPGSPKALRLAMDEIVLKEAGHLVAQARGPGEAR
jgi:molybdenum cofactor biosynthesis protein B